ncbi:MAG TPA: hypothetical protein VGP61_06645 [Gemmatimonadales bacterium]|jgi:hypothetical protein|nr:hypothetical protein [Gemmatimonadales bacterium]
MRRSLLLPIAGALLLALMAKPATAQTCTGNPCNVTTTATLTVNDVLRLTLDAIATDLGTPVEADFDAGYKAASGPTATVKANRPWTVAVVGVSTVKFTYTGSLTDPDKPASDLKWGTVAGTYGNNASASATLSSGNGTAGSAQQIFYKTLLSYTNDVTGSYALDVKFTLSAP